MAGPADWEFTQSAAATYLGGVDGEARLHSALSSPLAGEGDYCRDFTRTGGGDSLLLHSLDAGVNAGEFVSISEAFSWSVRAWLRQADLSPTAVGIGIKVGVHVDNLNHSGYRAMFGHHIGFTNGIDLATADETGGDSTLAIYASGVFPAGVWRKGRLDVIPDDVNQDTLFVYTGTGTTGSEIWTLRNSPGTVITSGMPNYCPWSDASSGKLGVFYSTKAAGLGACYADRFQVFKEPVP